MTSFLELSFNADNETVDPAQLAMLNRVYQSACKSRGYEAGTDEADALARLIFRMYQAGTRDEALLKAATE